MADGFAPELGAEPRVLILGSLPGEPSIRAQQYYANPQNAFWPIMEQLLGMNSGLDYTSRVSAIKEAGVALWDVLSSAPREGSLDSAIDTSSANTNDFVGLLEQHPSIDTIFLNGGTAATLFAQRVLPDLETSGHELTIVRLPSTSPANTSLTRSGKLEAWSVVRNALGVT